MNIIIKRILKGGLGLFIDSIAITFLNFIFVFIAAKFLGPTWFGLLAISLSVFTVIEIFSNFGLPNTIQRFLSGRGEKNANKIYGTIFLIGFISAFITFIILFFSATFISNGIFNEPKLEYLLKYLSIALLFSSPSVLIKAVLIAKEKIDSVIIIDIINYGARIIIFVILFLFFKEINVVVWAINIGYIISVVIAVFYLRKLNLKPEFNFSFSYYRNVISYSLPLLFVGFSYVISQQSDRLMLGILSTTFAVGIYELVSKLAQILQFLHGSFVRIFMPIASEAFRDGNINDIKKSYFFISRWVSITNSIILMIFAGFGGKIISLFGQDFSIITSYRVLLILGIYSFFGTWVGPSGALLQMTNKQKIELINTVVFILINISLNYFLIPIYGIFGAAYATLISGVIRNVMQAIEIRLIYKFLIFNISHLILLFVSIGVTLLIYYFGSYFNIDIILSLITASLVVLFVFLSVTNDERIIFNKIKVKLFDQD